MNYSDERTALFIDGSNLHASAKALNLEIDYKKLKNEFIKRGKLLRAYYYTALIENEENSWGLDDCLTISDVVPIVMDIHHHWIREGVYITPEDDRVQRVIDSWRGVRPTMHYSVSREDYLVDHDTTIMPDYTTLLESGHKKQKLRAHSDFYWNQKTNEWAITFLKQFDMMCESKGKNLASIAIHNQAKSYLENN